MATKEQREQMYATEFVQAHIEAAVAFGRSEWEEGARHCVRGNLLACAFESPLEMAFYAWWWVITNRSGGPEPNFEMKIQQQVHARGTNYRADFVLEDTDQQARERAIRVGMHPLRIAIEVDGHEFHERTKEQVAHRDARDRDLQADGWRVFHVSGSAFHRDPEGCVYRIYLDAHSLLWRTRRSLMRFGPNDTYDMDNPDA